MSIVHRDSAACIGPDGPDRPPPRSVWTRRVTNDEGDDLGVVTEFVPANYDRLDDRIADYRRHRDVLTDNQTEWLDRVEAAMTEAAATIRTDRLGLVAALDHLGVEVTFDVRSQRHWWRDLHNGHPQSWQSTTKRLDASIRARIAEAFPKALNGHPLNFGRDSWPTALNAVLHDNERDFFGDWLHAQPAWDGEPRLGDLMARMFELADRTDPLAEWAGYGILGTAVMRCYQPGAKADEIAVWVGPQGCGKSTLLRRLLPDGHWGDRWFSDSLDLSADSKAFAENLQGCVLVEASEMVGSTKAEIERLKAVLSRTNDTTRLSYRADPEDLLRRAVIIGTTNSAESLPNDPTGLRRFVPIEITDGDPTYIRTVLDAKLRGQLWAEALARYNAGEHPRLPDVLKATQRSRAEAHRHRDILIEDALSDWLTTSAPHEFLMRDAAQGCGLVRFGETSTTVTARDAARLRKALRSLGSDIDRRTERGNLWTNPVHNTARQTLDF